MTGPTNHEIVQVFLNAQDLLHSSIRDNRVQLDLLTYKDLNTILGLALSVETIAAAGDTPVDMALHRLACTTGAVLTTAAIDSPDNAAIVREWRSSRAEYEQLAAQAGQ